MAETWYKVKHNGTLPGWQICTDPMPNMFGMEDDIFRAYCEKEEHADRIIADHEAVTRYKEALERLDGMGWFLHTHFEERECPHCIAHAALVTSQAGESGAIT